jgi:hypothetical protein
MQLKMDPQSSQTIPAKSVDSVRQTVHIKNPNQVCHDERAILSIPFFFASNIHLLFICKGSYQAQIQSYIRPTWC